jgi:hypothetical protein
MKQYKHNMIIKSQRAIAYLLLACQLLTSCGGKNTLLPRDPNAKPTITIYEHETTCTEDNELDGYPQPISFIDATPLKLGQKEIQFTWDKEEGLQAFVVDPSIVSTDTYVLIQNTPIIKDVNGKLIHFSQLNKKQAEFIANGLKWEVNKAGELKENGVRLRGGGKRGSSQGGTSDKEDGEKEKDNGQGEEQDTGQQGSGKEVVQKKGKGVEGPKASAKAERKPDPEFSAACAAADTEQKSGEQQDTMFKNALYAAILFLKYIPMGGYSSVYKYLITIKKEEGKDIVEGPEPDKKKLNLPTTLSQEYRDKTLDTWKQLLNTDSKDQAIESEKVTAILNTYKEFFPSSQGKALKIKDGAIKQFIETIFFNHFLPNTDQLQIGKYAKGGTIQMDGNLAHYFGWIVKTQHIETTQEGQPKLECDKNDEAIRFLDIDLNEPEIESNNKEQKLEQGSSLYDNKNTKSQVTRDVLSKSKPKLFTDYSFSGGVYLYKVHSATNHPTYVLNITRSEFEAKNLKGVVFYDKDNSNPYSTFFANGDKYFYYDGTKVEEIEEELSAMLQKKAAQISCLALTGKLPNTKKLPHETTLPDNDIFIRKDKLSSKSSSKSKSSNRYSAITENSLQSKNKPFLESLEDSKDCIYFDPIQFLKGLQEKNKEVTDKNKNRFFQIQDAFAELICTYNARQEETEKGCKKNKICGSVLLIYEDDTSGILPITNIYKEKDQINLDEDVKVITNILRGKIQPIEKKLKSLDTDIKKVQKERLKITMSEDTEQKIRDYLNECNLDHVEKNKFTQEQINKFIESIKGKEYTTIIKLINNQREMLKIFGVLQNLTPESKKKLNNLQNLLSLIESNNSDFTKNNEALQNLEIPKTKLENQLNAIKKLLAKDREIAVRRGHSESILLQYAKVASLPIIKKEKIKKAYILLLSTNIICSVCTNIISPIKDKITQQLIEIGLKFSVEKKPSLNELTTLLYSPMLSQKAVSGDPHKHTVFVKLNEDAKLYDKALTEILSSKSIKGHQIIIFDKNLEIIAVNEGKPFKGERFFESIGMPELDKRIAKPK